MPTILLTGDVMLGRGIDQVLHQPSPPEIYESFCKSALDYVALAEAKSGAIPRSVPCDYIWGDALDALRAADATIINLETAVTCCELPTPKGINYRCHPANLPCLAAAGVDCCVLANNHILDWGEDGLIETLEALEAERLPYAGIGRDLLEAEAPAVLPLPQGGRVLVHALGSPSSGVPRSWAARPGRPGVNWLDDYDSAAERLVERVGRDKQPSDIAIVSIHWGSNWGYDIPEADRGFARRLIDEAQADVVHGHSSHHPKAIELYRDKPILYGCGDFLNDYEGISGEEAYHADLVLGYRISFERDGRCSLIELLPFRIAKFRLNHAAREETEWLAATLDRECRRFGGHVALEGDVLHLKAPGEVRSAE